MSTTLVPTTGKHLRIGQMIEHNGTIWLISHLDALGLPLTHTVLLDLSWVGGTMDSSSIIMSYPADEPVSVLQITHDDF